MRRTLIALAVLLLAVPATANVTLGPGGSVTYLRTEDQTKDVGNLFAELEWSTPIDEDGKHWLGMMGAYDGDAFAGMGVRWYFQQAGGVIYPGLGVSAYTLSQDSELVEETTILVGPEVMLEVGVPVGDAYLPVTMFAGLFPSLEGDEVTMIRFGIRVSPDLLQD